MDNRLKEIADILSSHRGKGNEITSASIAKMIGIDEDDTHAQTRALIKQAAEKFELPLSSNNNGYFIITSEAELDSYVSNLDSRIKGIEDRKKTMIENYRKANK